MADFNSTQYAAAFPSTGVAEYLRPDEIHGRTRVAYASYTGTNTLAQDDRIVLFKLPLLARPLFVEYTNGAFGASVTLALGDGTDADLFLTATSVATAGSGVVATASHARLTAETTVYATLGGANPADDQDLSVSLFYAVD